MSPLLLPAAVAALVAIMLFAVWWVNFVAKFAIGNRHQWISEILETRLPPEKWRGSTPNGYKTLKKLDQLIEYVKMTRFADSEDDRCELIAELSDIRAEWETNGVKEHK